MNEKNWPTITTFDWLPFRGPLGGHRQHTGGGMHSACVRAAGQRGTSAAAAGTAWVSASGASEPRPRRRWPPRQSVVNPTPQRAALEINGRPTMRRPTRPSAPQRREVHWGNLARISPTKCSPKDRKGRATKWNGRSGTRLQRTAAPGVSGTPFLAFLRQNILSRARGITHLLAASEEKE